MRYPSLTNRTAVAGPTASSPVWARDERTLFHLQRDAGQLKLVAHSVAPDGRLAPHGRDLFSLDALGLVPYGPVTGFDVSLDGQRFLFVQRVDAPRPAPPRQIHIVEHWFEELQAKVPPGDNSR